MASKLRGTIDVQYVVELHEEVEGEDELMTREEAEESLLSELGLDADDVDVERANVDYELLEENDG